MALIEITVACPSCKTEFEVEEVNHPSLAEQIALREQESEHDGREEVERETAGMVWPHEAVEARDLQDLSFAIRRRDWAEAELLVDRIAANIGTDAEEKVAQGRFSLLAAA